MKNSILAILILSTITFGLKAQIKTPASSPVTTITQELGLSKIAVSYSRPSVKGRKIFGNLVPFGKVWRTGANQITSIKFDADVFINGQSVKAGSYGVYTIPGQKAWKVMLNSDDKQWGAYAYDDKKDVATFEIVPTKLLTNVEHMTIEFVDFTQTTTFVKLSWEKTAIKFKVEQMVQDQILAEIKEKTASPDATIETLEGAADYYYQNNINLPQALEWATKVVEKDQKYWTYQLVARIAAKMGKCDIAIPNAEKSMALAVADKDDAYILLNKNVMEKCKGKK
jgi:Protein of unknown function (DUF2911)